MRAFTPPALALANQRLVAKEVTPVCAPNPPTGGAMSDDGHVCLIMKKTSTMMRVVFLLAFVNGLTSCPFTVNHLNRLPGSEPLAEPVLFNQPGPLFHEATGFYFPEWYDNFQRVTAFRYDTAGQHVSIGYNDRRPDCLIVATFSVYPTPKMTFVGVRPQAVSSMEQSWLDDELERVKAEIEHHHPAMHSAVVGPAATPSSPALDGVSLSYREAEAASEMHLFVYDHQWFLKYRFTYPQSCKEAASARIEAILSQLPWASPE